MILVTGGAGFIGSNLVAALEKRGERVAVCDRLRLGEKWRNLSKHFIEEIIAPEQLTDFLDRTGGDIEIIFHMGAISSTTERNADLIIDNNFRLSCRLWRWCEENGVRFVYASSAATYGDGSAGFRDEETPDALAKLRPLNAYGWSKHLFDRWALRHKERGNGGPTQCVGLKFFNVYGPNEYHKGGMRSVVHQIFPFALRDESFPLFRSYDPRYPDGGQLRDFVWVRDCVDVMLWLLDRPKVNGLFNLGTGKARSFADLSTAVYLAAGKDPMLTYRDMPEELRPKYQYFTEASMAKLQAAGYTDPFTTLEEGVREYVQKFLAQPDPYI